jgi:phage/plasmid-associated DNA primase
LFYADTNIRNKYDELIPGFLWLMLQDLNNYINYGMDEPPAEVMEATESYQQSNDILLEFYNELLEKTDSEDDQATIHQIYTAFKEWYVLAYPNSKIPSRNSLKDDMIKTYGMPDKNTWRQIKLKDPE